jgi:hypothetical protein
MQRIFFVLLLIAGLHTGAAAANIKCPEGTVENGVQTPDLTEAWCEKKLDQKVVKQGPYRAWRADGGLQTSGYYADGEPVSKWSHWHPNGRLRAFEWFTDGKIVRIQAWDELGQRLSEPAP